jgi:hypothetical protein
VRGDGDGDGDGDAGKGVGIGDPPARRFVPAVCSNSQKLVMLYGGTWDTIYCGALMFIYSFTTV